MGQAIAFLQGASEKIPNKLSLLTSITIELVKFVEIIIIKMGLLGVFFLMLITLNEKIDKEIIDRGRKLKVISTYSVGYEHPISIFYVRKYPFPHITRSRKKFDLNILLTGKIISGYMSCGNNVVHRTIISKGNKEFSMD